MSVKCFYVGSKLILTLFVKSEFLPWNRSELANGTPWVGFSRSDSEGVVYSKIDFDTFFKSEFLPPAESNLIKHLEAERYLIWSNCSSLRPGGGGERDIFKSPLRFKDSPSEGACVSVILNAYVALDWRQPTSN